AKRIVDELEYIVTEFKMTNFFFQDSNFFGPNEFGEKRSIAIGNEIIKRNLKINFIINSRLNDISTEAFKVLKKAGLDGVFVGIETSSNSRLKRFNKGIQENTIW